MDAPTLAGLLTAASVLLSLILWLPIVWRVSVRRTEVYLSGEPQAHFPLGVTEISWAIRRTLEKLYLALLNHVQTGVFNDWFALSLPYLLLLLALLTAAIIARGCV